MSDALTRLQVRAALHSLEDRYDTRADLLRALEKFVIILIPKKQLPEIIAEELSVMPQLHSVKSLASYRLAAAVMLSSLRGDARTSGSVIGRRWLRRLRANLNRIRLGARNIGVAQLPLLDRVEHQLDAYVWAIFASERLATAQTKDMPPGLAAALAELFVEACVGYPGLAEHIVISGLIAANAPRSSFVARLEQSIVAALDNEPAPNDLRHHSLQVERASFVFDPTEAARTFRVPHRIVYPHEPPRFFEANVQDHWFVATAREAPKRVRRLLRAA